MKFIMKFAKPEKRLKFHEICQGGWGHMYFFTKFHVHTCYGVCGPSAADEGLCTLVPFFDRVDAVWCVVAIVN